MGVAPTFTRVRFSTSWRRAAPILLLRKSYTEALQFKNSTGAGQLDGEERNSGVLKRCQYFDDLNKVLFHQAASMPKNGADTLSMGDTDPSSVQLDLIMRNIIGRDDDAEGIEKEDDKDEDDREEEDKNDREEDDNVDEDGDGEEHPPIAVIATPARRSVACSHRAANTPKTPLSLHHKSAGEGMTADDEMESLQKIAEEHAQRRHDEVIRLEKKKMEAERERFELEKKKAEVEKKKAEVEMKKAEQEVSASKLEMWHKHVLFNMERRGLTYEAAAADASPMMPSFLS
ncbi:hypothetical protein I350_05467 [Cryptococcus amylolentus CBS 6273]|uniref:Uncharacterized protein n=1 Tax=Cryptococcus amylolentus CBS 6273 TaxID=1296118 RepID=A0A1E3JXF0_9TREE|nr:hypothetical protein I350_05467 [Cryptococcus amylolentus CBS 6273]